MFDITNKTIQYDSHSHLFYKSMALQRTTPQQLSRAWNLIYKYKYVHFSRKSISCAQHVEPKKCEEVSSLTGSHCAYHIRFNSKITLIYTGVVVCTTSFLYFIRMRLTLV